MKRLLFSAAAAVVLFSATAEAQTANSSPTAPAPPGLPGTPRGSSTTAPSGGTPLPLRRVTKVAKPATGVSAAKTRQDREDEKKLEQDLHICIGC